MDLFVWRTLVLPKLIWSLYSYIKCFINPQVLFSLGQPFWYTEPSRRGKKALGNGSAALSRLMYGPVHFQGPASDEQF